MQGHSRLPISNAAYIQRVGSQSVRCLLKLAFGEFFGLWSALGCVLRTASASIWRSSAFVFGGARVIDACQ
jgi:hypothetical protein